MSNTSAADGILGTIGPLTEQNLPIVWDRLIRHFAEKSPILAGYLKSPTSPAIFGPNSLAIRFPSRYSHYRDSCATDQNVRRIQDGLAAVLGHPVNVRCDLDTAHGPDNPADDGPAKNGAAGRRKDLMQLPLFRKAGEVFAAQIVNDDPAFDPAAPAPPPKPQEP